MRLAARDMCARGLDYLKKQIGSSAVINFANEEYAHEKYSYPVQICSRKRETGDGLSKSLSHNYPEKRSR